jgi:hypothetical protein
MRSTSLLAAFFALAMPSLVAAAEIVVHRDLRISVQ